TLRHVNLGHEEVALADEGRIDPQAEARSPAPLVARMTNATGAGCTRSRLQRIGGAVVARIDHVRSAHDLGTTPRLIDAQVGNDVAGLHAAIGASPREQRSATTHCSTGCRRS